MVRKNVTVYDLLSGLHIKPVAIQKSQPVRGMNSVYYDLNAFDAPIVGLYEGDKWSVFSYGFYDANDLFKNFRKINRYSGVLKDYDDKFVQYGFIYKADLNFFEFSEELFGPKSLKEEKLYKLSGIGTVYKADKRKAFINFIENFNYRCYRVFKSYYWASEIKSLSRHSRLVFPEKVKLFLKNLASNLENKHDKRIDLTMDVHHSGGKFKKVFRIALIRLSLSFTDFKCQSKVALMRAIFPKLFFVNKYYRLSFKRVQSQVWNFVQNHDELKQVMFNEHGVMNVKQEHEQFMKSLYRYIILVGWDSELLAECFETFGEANFNKLAKAVASGLAVKSVLASNIVDMPDEWVQSLYMAS